MSDVGLIVQVVLAALMVAGVIWAFKEVKKNKDK